MAKPNILTVISLESCILENVFPQVTSTFFVQAARDLWPYLDGQETLFLSRLSLPQRPELGGPTGCEESGARKRILANFPRATVNEATSLGTKHRITRSGSAPSKIKEINRFGDAALALCSQRADWRRAAGFNGLTPARGRWQGGTREVSAREK